MGHSHVHDLFGSTYLGLTIRQYWADLALWEKFLGQHSDIRLLIELGTFKAGMALFLRGQAIQRGISFWTFDKTEPDELDSAIARALRLRGCFIHGDFFDNRRELLLGLLGRTETKMLFVDGSDKPREFVEFVPYLKRGDYVSVHDYGTEFQPKDVSPVEHLLEQIFVDECKRLTSLTRFWRIR